MAIDFDIATARGTDHTNTFQCYDLSQSQKSSSQSKDKQVYPSAYISLKMFHLVGGGNYSNEPACIIHVLSNEA